MERWDVLIVGGGPAGLSAAVWLGRCRRSVLLCDSGNPRNRHSEGVYGFLTRDGVDPLELRARGRAEAERYGVVFEDLEVVDAVPDGHGYTATLADGRQVGARKLLLASGVVDTLPEIPGLQAMYGHSVFHCPYCDGYEVRDRPLAAWGQGDRGAALALTLKRWSDDVHLFTDGSEGQRPIRDSVRAVLDREGVVVHPEPILALRGDGARLREVALQDASAVPRSALFFTSTRRQASELPARLGCRFDRYGAVLTDRKQEARQPDLFVAGDAARDVNFAIVAAAEGARAAYAINTVLTLEDQRRGSIRPG